MTETSTNTPTGTTGERAPWPAGRYGRRRERRSMPRTAVVALAAVTAVAMSAVGWQLFRAYGDGDYSASVTRFTDMADDQVVITILVRMPADGTATCTLRARNAAGVQVGIEDVTVSPGPDPARTQVTHRLVTSGRPVTGEVKGCRPA
ncbi:DUF4307 domain-containing protein [Catellatospora sp. KI3]|uniref:DUF4307 domain-containing protein n=1 Tax=Catellatospora sp. KI3 TaxID=3041620 RepID=UPI002482F74D|nr:DUF4307 domain-containing protein [Catellatospora sp. KI3]MDI1460445.1 DUF4307 domain-containing protein [Catellatospora sp. KI3]